MRWQIPKPQLCTGDKKKHRRFRSNIGQKSRSIWSQVWILQYTYRERQREREIEQTVSRTSPIHYFSHRSNTKEKRASQAKQTEWIVISEGAVASSGSHPVYGYMCVCCDCWWCCCCCFTPFVYNIYLFHVVKNVKLLSDVIKKGVVVVVVAVAGKNQRRREICIRNMKYQTKASVLGNIVLCDEINFWSSKKNIAFLYQISRKLIWVKQEYKKNSGAISIPQMIL